MKPFIKAHIVRVLAQYQSELTSGSLILPYRFAPFELYLKKYLKNNRETFTPVDNSFVISSSFKLLRFKEFLDHAFHCKDWSERLENLDKINEVPLEFDKTSSIPMFF